MLECPVCKLKARDVEGNERGELALTPPLGALVLCECGAVNRAEAPAGVDLFDVHLGGARELRTITAAEFDELAPHVRRSLEGSIEALKRAGRYGVKPASELDECADCGHERRQHLDVRWPCNMLACGCRGFKARPRELTP